MYSQVPFKKVQAVKIGSINGGVYRKVSGGGHAFSVYAGAGGLGTKTSTSSHSVVVAGGHIQYGGFRIIGHEKETMQNLNERLASYMNQVRILEKANAELDIQIKEWYSKNSGSSERDDQRYFQTIEDLKKQEMDDLHKHATGAVNVEVDVAPPVDL